MIAADDRAHESLEKAASMESRADGIEAALDRSIYSDDADVVEQLRGRIEALEARREKIKADNAAYKAAHGSELAAISSLYERDQAMPHPGWELRNLSGNIKRNKDRLAQIEREKVNGPPLRQILVKWAGVCSECGEKIEKGSVAFYRKPDLFCEGCRPGKPPEVVAVRPCGYQVTPDTCSKPNVEGPQAIDCANCTLETGQALAARAAAVTVESAPVVSAPAPDPEASLRALWTARGVSEERQAELIADVTAKAQPGASVGPWTL
jgi:hypothetical protein